MEKHCMTFTHEDIKKYQDLCHKYFDEEIDEKTAIEEMHSLILMVSLIYHPATHQHLKRLKEIDQEASGNDRPGAKSNT